MAVPTPKHYPLRGGPATLVPSPLNQMKSNVHSSHEYGATVLRIALGAVMLAHAAAKYFLFTLPGTAAFFEATGFPGWTAYPVFLIEAAGGAALVAGYHSRIAALSLIPVMIGAAAVHAGNGWMFTAPNGGWEYPVFLIAALGAQTFLGDGAYALSSRARRVAAAVR